jgi:probable DNA metabolism protein
MTTAIFDGSFEGLLKLSAFLHTSGLYFDEVSDIEDNSSLFSENIYAQGDEPIDTKKLDLQKLKTVFLANDKATYKTIVRHYFEATEGRYTMETNAKLNELEHLVRREAHKYTGFTRFEMTDVGFFARIAPKHDILPLIAPHFHDRFKDERVIFDENRQVAALINKQGYKLVLATIESFEKCEEEKRFEGLWKKFFESVSIKERTNKQLQQSFVPLRYRKFMGEFSSSIYTPQAEALSHLPL